MSSPSSVLTQGWGGSWGSPGLMVGLGFGATAPVASGGASYGTWSLRPKPKQQRRQEPQREQPPKQESPPEVRPEPREWLHIGAASVPVITAAAVITAERVTSRVVAMESIVPLPRSEALLETDCLALARIRDQAWLDHLLMEGF